MEKQVVNFNQAISVLLQAADMGRAKGIFEWDDLALVGQAIKFINNIQAQAKADVKQSDAKDNTTNENVVEKSVPAPETKQVILEQTKG